MTGSQIISVAFAAAALVGIGMVIGVHVNIKGSSAPRVGQEGSVMELTYLPANAAWAFVWNDDLIKLEGYPRFFTSHQSAVAAAKAKGLIVYVDGTVVTKEAFAEAHATHASPMSLGEVRRCGCGDQTYMSGGW